MAEKDPAAGAVRIGVEIEGIGEVKLTWPQTPSLLSGLSKADLQTKVTEIEEFQETLKRQPLIRTGSFTLKPGQALGTRKQYGVTIHTELVSAQSLAETPSLLGAEHPAELVSAPHLLEAASLTRLALSVRKALNSGLKGKTHGENTVCDPYTINEPDSKTAHNLQVTADFVSSKKKNQIATGIQTTIGVAADKLLSTDAQVRKRVTDLLVENKSTEQLDFIRMIDAACAAESAVKGVFSGDARFRFRLVILMALLNVHAPSLKITHKRSYEKSVYGANIKGYSSCKGCGLDGSKVDANVKSAVIAALKEAKIGDKEAQAAGDILGDPGLSAQVAFEEGQPIACFTVDNKLYTVIEARQSIAPINDRMLKMFSRIPEGTIGTHREATETCSYIKKELGM